MLRISNIPFLVGLSAAPLISLAATFQEVIRGHGELSALAEVAERHPSVVGNLTTEGGTLLAPTNDALIRFLATVGIRDIAGVTEATALALVSYHILPQTLSRADLSLQGGIVADTYLNRSMYANLGGAANVVFASAYGSTGQFQSEGSLEIYSGAGPASNVTATDIQFDNGYIHIIDRVLNLPQTPSRTVEAAQLSNLAQALQKANLTTIVDSIANLTIFAPTNDAFREAGIRIDSLSVEELSDALQYHAFAGTLGYSTVLENGKEYSTLLGPSITVHKRDGQMFVNDAAVVVGNIVTTNGVAYIINSVLSPPSSPSATSTTPDGATSSSDLSSGGSTTGSSTSSDAGSLSLASSFIAAVVAFASGFLLV